MTNERLVLNAHMNGLLSELGGIVAANAVIEARSGRTHSAGTLSQKKNGHADWTVMDIIYLQEAARRTPVTDWLVSLNEDDPTAAVCRNAAAARFMIESGELAAAIITAKTPEEVAKAHKEYADARDALDDVGDSLGLSR